MPEPGKIHLSIYSYIGLSEHCPSGGMASAGVYLSPQKSKQSVSSLVQESALHSGESLTLITHDIIIDLLPAQPQKYSDSPKEPMSSNIFLCCNNPTNDRNRSPGRYMVQ